MGGFKSRFWWGVDPGMEPDILFLMETRLAKDKGKQVWVKFGFSDGWEITRVGFGGGLILA